MAWRLLAEAYDKRGEDGLARLATAEDEVQHRRHDAGPRLRHARPRDADQEQPEWRRATDIVLVSQAQRRRPEGAGARGLRSAPALRASMRRLGPAYCAAGRGVALAGVPEASPTRRSASACAPTCSNIPRCCRRPIAAAGQAGAGADSAAAQDLQKYRRQSSTTRATSWPTERQGHRGRVLRLQLRLLQSRPRRRCWPSSRPTGRALRVQGLPHLRRGLGVAAAGRGPAPSRPATTWPSTGSSSAQKPLTDDGVRRIARGQRRRSRRGPQAPGIRRREARTSPTSTTWPSTSASTARRPSSSATR